MTEVMTKMHHKIMDGALFWVSITFLFLLVVRGYKEIYIEDVILCSELCKPFKGFHKIYFDLTGKMCECNNKMNFELR